MTNDTDDKAELLRELANKIEANDVSVTHFAYQPRIGSRTEQELDIGWVEL